MNQTNDPEPWSKWEDWWNQVRGSYIKDWNPFWDYWEGKVRSQFDERPSAKDTFALRDHARKHALALREVPAEEDWSLND
jgi:hypothetical protein